MTYGNDHDHRGEYADDRHTHYDYADEHHRHYDDEREVDRLKSRVQELEYAVDEMRRAAPQPSTT
jgi:hypothetical protein